MTDDKITSGSIGTVMDFTFDDEWDGLSKIAIFSGSGTTIQTPIVSGQCVIPWETVAQSGGELLIGVKGTGTNKTIPTIWTSTIIYDGASESGAVASGTPPTPSVTDRLQEEIGDLGDLGTSSTDSLVDAINSVQSDINEKIGNLFELNTTNQDDLVSAINEIFNKVPYIATYGATSFAAIKTYYDNNVPVFCKYNSRIYLLTEAAIVASPGVSKFTFTALVKGTTNVAYYLQVVSTSSTWSNGTIAIESGGGSSDSGVFIATYGTTSSADIADAYNAGKMIFASKDGERFGILDEGYLDDGFANFFSIAGRIIYTWTCDNDTWSTSYYEVPVKWSDFSIATSGAVSTSLSPNTNYIYTGALTSLTITGITAVGHYHFRFTATIAITLTMPSSVTMPDNFAVESGRIYEIDILDSLATVQSWAIRSS